ncbi:cytochrome P450 [Gymnopilus junonius]|uniref:Cytochrome P450 n=1 Tax=Gymnopilus junonius TaxID=109634 RepID=A0A9P5NFK1_GYMJU|nr:cytochrome P450 [Gymnopilus junonius]
MKLNPTAYLLGLVKPDHPWLILAGVVLLAILRRITKPDPLKDIPGPWLAKHTPLLLAYHTRTGKRYLYVDKLHKKYGPFVRITPTQVSCAHPTAPSVIYAQGSASLPKTPFYRSFYVNGTPSLFSTQDRVGHSSKRRVLAHPFSYASVKQFEDWIRRSVAKMVMKLDQRARKSGVGISATTLGRASGSDTGPFGGVESESGEEVDVLMWLNYLTFDVISDLAFGEPLGMLDRETDVLLEDTKKEKSQAGVAAMIDFRGRTAAFLGLFPTLLPGSILEPLTRWIPDPFVQRGLQGTNTLSLIAQRCVKHRLDSDSSIRRGDLLDQLVDDMRSKQAQSHDRGGEGEVSEADVVTDAMLLLTAGSDTTANSTAAILFWIYSTPRVLEKLRDELTETLSAPLTVDSTVTLTFSDDNEATEEVADALGVPLHDQLKNLKYLSAVIDEGLRMFATNAFGLPRAVPEGTSVTVEDKTFYEGIELSTPAYTIQHDVAIWGTDADVFRPERWLASESASCAGSSDSESEKLGPAELKKYLLTFGVGPRACIGKNLAMLQMQILVAAFVMRYDLELRDKNELRSVEGFMHKPVDLWARIGMRGGL